MNCQDQQNSILRARRSFYIYIYLYYLLYILKSTRNKLKLRSIQETKLTYEQFLFLVSFNPLTPNGSYWTHRKLSILNLLEIVNKVDFNSQKYLQLGVKGLNVVWFHIKLGYCPVIAPPTGESAPQRCLAFGRSVKNFVKKRI